MEIREASKADIPEIISLLKKSLGESLLPKSEAYFIWKHYDNPFGLSKILLACQNEKIIGLRAFMKWTWSNNESNVKAVRAVDTATDPDYQGKGIFRTLTMAAVDICKTEGVGFVFNSPNQLSIKGYLKMGWYAIGKMPIYISPGSLIPNKFNENRIEKAYKEFDIVTELGKLGREWKLVKKNMVMHTELTYDYLKWRYVDCPVAKYGSCIEAGKFGIVFRLKKINKFTELRICEIWTESTVSEKLLKFALKQIIKKVKPVMVSCAPSCSIDSNSQRLPMMWGPFRKGPVVTLRKLSFDNLKNFDQFYNWNPSIGSMELF